MHIDIAYNFMLRTEVILICDVIEHTLPQIYMFL